jgi:hypothetical protein
MAFQMVLLKPLQSSIKHKAIWKRVIATFRNISQDVNASSSKFGESQLTFSKYSNEFLQNNSSHHSGNSKVTFGCKRGFSRLRTEI